LSSGVTGRIYRVSGPLVIAEGMRGTKVYEVVEVGEERLIGETIGVEGDKAIIQVYEDTTGLKIGEPVYGTGTPLAAELGPGLISSIYDGIQRPLPVLNELVGFFVKRGVKAAPLPRDKKWYFKSLVKPGDKVNPGDFVGVVEETTAVKHYIMVPPDVHGVVEEVVSEGDYTVDTVIARINGVDVKMYQKWPVRKPRPYREKLEPREPLITTQRTIDFFFPLVRGGKAAIPGGFGTGKCVLPGTPVLLSNWELVEIDELFKRIKNGEPNYDLEEEFVEVKNPLYVYSFDGEKWVLKKVTHVYRGYTNYIVRIETASGRLIEVTPLHKLPVYTSNGNIEFIEAFNIKPGEKLVVPRKLPDEESIEKQVFPLEKLDKKSELTGSIEVKLPKFIDADLAEFIGLIIANAEVEDGGRIIYRYRNEYARIRFLELLKKLFNIDVQELNNELNEIVVNSPLLVRILEVLEVYDAKEGVKKRVPGLIMRSDLDTACGFIRGYFIGRGRFTDGSLEFTPLPRRMTMDLSYLLLKTGILYVVERVDGDMYRLIISDSVSVKRFYTLILRNYVEDFDQVKPSGGLAYSSSLSIFAEGSASGLMLLVKSRVESPGISEYIALDDVVSVELIEKKTVVYDLVVEDTHNFIGGFTPVIFHNTVMLQTLTKWSWVDIAIYVGCGERGNEMADALHSFRKLVDPRTGKLLVERSVFIANTSNMPVAAREASVFLGATIGEYFRDMGYHVLMVADSTSRWAEAMREISGRLEELPGEEGFPAYLGSRLASFYERSGYVLTLGKPDRYGSLTIMGAVSPPGADFSEPVTQATLRIVRAFYALDVALAYRRHYPAINWLTSYSLYLDNVAEWWHKNVTPEWREMRDRAMSILQREAELEELVRLVGIEALPEEDKLTLEIARMIREDFLRQDALHEIDCQSPPLKTAYMMKAIMLFYDYAKKAIGKGITVDRIRELKCRAKIARMKYIPNINFEDEFKQLLSEIEKEFNELLSEVEVLGKI